MCKKESQKISALARLSCYFTNDLKFLLVNSVIKSQFMNALFLFPEWYFIGKNKRSIVIQ